MAQHSAYDQYLLELVNRARLDPGAEAARYGVSLGSISAASKQPLAGNTDLAEAAEGHSRWMIDTDTFSHTGAGGSSPGQRMTAAGYPFSGSWSWGENIAWQGTTGTPNMTQFVADLHASLFRSSGHRDNMLNDGFREAGMGVEQGRFGSYNAVMATEDFARSGGAVYLTGVAYTDADGNHFYTPGEGMGSVHVDLHAVTDGRTVAAVTAAAGGYEGAVAAGTYDVALSGGGLSGDHHVTLAIASQNVKLDLIGSDGIASSASVALGAGLKAAALLGTAALNATGNALGNVLTGNAGANVLDGAAGADTLQGGAGNDVFVLRAGEADGDRILDFTGNGSAAGDSLRFEGYGAGATFTLRADGLWQLSDGVHTDIVGITGAVHASDYSFGSGSGSGDSGSGNPGTDPTPITDPVTGTTGNDVLSGSAGGDTIGGGGGADTLYGNTGNDWLYGGAGADRIYGGSGDDVLFGGDGADRLQGGGGADRFVYRSLSERGDTITDFHAAEGDRLDLRPLLSALGYHGADALGDGIVELVQTGGAVLIEVHPDPAGAGSVVIATVSHTSVAAVEDHLLIA